MMFVMLNNCESSFAGRTSAEVLTSDVLFDILAEFVVSEPAVPALAEDCPEEAELPEEELEPPELPPDPEEAELPEPEEDGAADCEEPED